MFSPDGHRLLTFGLADATSSNATLWEVPGGRRLATLPETELAFSGEFSPDGQHFVTVGPTSRRVQLWRTTDDQPAVVASWSPYTAAAFLSNSQIAVAGIRTLEVRGLDGTSTLPPVAIPQAAGIVVPQDGTALVVPTDTGAIHVVRRQRSFTSVSGAAPARRHHRGASERRQSMARGHELGTPRSRLVVGDW